MALLTSLWTRLLILIDGFVALGRLIGLAAASLFGINGTIGSRLIASLTAPEGLRIVFAVARTFLPNFAVRTKIITAYDNVGTVLVTRFDDVKEVLRRDGDFEVVYGARMMQITGGSNFFLGMQDSPEYTRDVSNMRLAVRRSDLPGIVQPQVAARAVACVASAKGRIDVPQDLTLRVPADLLATYFGIPGPTERELIDWTALTFWYLFADLNADTALDARALDAAAKCRSYLDTLVVERKTQPTGADDIVNRCLAMQGAGLPGMDDIGIRNNLIGLIIGAIPTLSKAAVQALDQLLERPAMLAAAQDAARAGNDALLGRHVFEALRFNPINPVLYRRAVRDTVIAANTRRAVKVPRSSMVLAANLSAMFDRLKLDAPEDFRIDRPWDAYILWGDGLHTCFGAHINQVALPGMLKPLLQKKSLRRAPGDIGRIDTEGTPFPVHLWLEFDED